MSFPAPELNAKPRCRQGHAQQDRSRTARSVWNAWSLLPLSNHPRLTTAPASWPHSKRFAWQFIHQNLRNAPAYRGMAMRRLCVPALSLPLVFAVALLAQLAGAQESSPSASLPRNRYRNGEETLSAFAPISEATRYSIVKFNVDGATVALGTVVDTNGLALTKASELKKGKLTCWLAVEKEVAAEVIATDEEEDVALVQVHARDLKPVRWDTDQVSEGQWAIPPGIAATPHAVGIISALPRRIRPPRAFIGVQFEFAGSTPKIQDLRAGFGAEKAGLKPGDIIVGLNHMTVTNREQVVETLREFREGQTVNLRVRREEKEFDAEVQLMADRSGQWSAEADPQERQRRLTGQVSQRAEGFEQAIEHDS